MRGMRTSMMVLGLSLFGASSVLANDCTKAIYAYDAAFKGFNAAHALVQKRKQGSYFEMWVNAFQGAGKKERCDNGKLLFAEVGKAETTSHALKATLDTIAKQCAGENREIAQAKMPSAERAHRLYADFKDFIIGTYGESCPDSLPNPLKAD